MTGPQVVIRCNIVPSWCRDITHPRLPAIPCQMIWNSGHKQHMKCVQKNTNHIYILCNVKFHQTDHFSCFVSLYTPSYNRCDMNLLPHVQYHVQSNLPHAYFIFFICLVKCVYTSHEYKFSNIYSKDTKQTCNSKRHNSHEPTSTSIPNQKRSSLSNHCPQKGDPIRLVTAPTCLYRFYVAAP